ncbi:MAG: hypothetical protein IPM53_01160 [Anaerolineaceae bacterium]|nr:hypothetical protein [Anaerolineaceae bacterium]
MNETISNALFNSVNGQISPAMNLERMAFISGILFGLMQFGALLYFIILVFPQMGPPDAAAQHVAYYTEHGMTLKLGNYLMTLPMPFFLLFLGGLSDVLGRSEGGGTLATAAVASGIIVAFLWPLSAVLNHIGIDIAQAGGDTASVVALDAIGVYMLALSTLPRAILLAAASVGLLYSRSVPGLMCWMGLALAVISLVGSATLVARQLFPMLALGTILFEVWVLLLSIVLLQNSINQ